MAIHATSVPAFSKLILPFPEVDLLMVRVGLPVPSPISNNEPGLSVPIPTFPSPFTPLSTLRMVELMSAALPKGLINVISGGDELGADLTSHSGINKIVFTGSIATGKKVMASASKHVTPVTLELGGNDPGILLPGTDPAPFVEGLFFGSMINSGQTCGALKRLYVHENDLNLTDYLD